jgi:hypothetical protein
MLKPSSFRAESLANETEGIMKKRYEKEIDREHEDP